MRKRYLRRLDWRELQQVNLMRLSNANLDSIQQQREYVGSCVREREKEKDANVDHCWCLMSLRGWNHHKTLRKRQWWAALPLWNNSNSNKQHDYDGQRTTTWARGLSRLFARLAICFEPSSTGSLTSSCWCLVKERELFVSSGFQLVEQQFRLNFLPSFIQRWHFNQWAH